MKLAECEAEVDRLRAIWGLPPGFRFVRSRTDDGAPHVEGEEAPFQFVVTERGQEHERREMSAEDLVFEAIWSDARGIALNVELKTRRDDYARATWFDGALRMMALLGEPWHSRAVDDYAQVLERAPLAEAERALTRVLDLSAYGVAP